MADDTFKNLPTLLVSTDSFPDMIISSPPWGCYAGGSFIMAIGTHFTNGLQAHNLNFVMVVFILILIVQSGLSYTAELSCSKLGPDLIFFLCENNMYFDDIWIMSS